MVAVLTRDPIPDEIASALSIKEPVGLVIEPALDALATWVGPRQASGEAALVLARYRVVPPTERGSPT